MIHRTILIKTNFNLSKKMILRLVASLEYIKLLIEDTAWHHEV